jgi:hypothetical protein
MSNKPISGMFEIRSFTSIHTQNQDLDVGVIRVTGDTLKQLGGRDALVRISCHSGEGISNSIIRIVRASTGKDCLTKGQIALQYEDRRRLGVPRLPATNRISIEPVNQMLNQPKFLWTHTSPLVRMNAIFGVTLTIMGTAIGLVIGWMLGSA